MEHGFLRGSKRGCQWHIFSRSSPTNLWGFICFFSFSLNPFSPRILILFHHVRMLQWLSQPTFTAINGLFSLLFDLDKCIFVNSIGYFLLFFSFWLIEFALHYLLILISYFVIILYVCSLWQATTIHVVPRRSKNHAYLSLFPLARYSQGIEYT